MDFISVLILGSVVVIAIVLIIGPIMEVRGKILFEEEKTPPKIKGRYGMGIMFAGLIVFFLFLLLRSLFSSAFVTPFVIGGYLIWILGGLIAVIRNETLKFMLSKEELERSSK